MRLFLTTVMTFPVTVLQLMALPRLLEWLVVVRLRNSAVLIMKARVCLRLKLSMLRPFAVWTFAS